MKINLNLSTKDITNFFQEKIVLSLTEQHKKILTIAAAAFGLLAACYLIKRCFKAKDLSDNEEQQINKANPKSIIKEEETKDLPEETKEANRDIRQEDKVKNEEDLDEKEIDVDPAADSKKKSQKSMSENAKTVELHTDIELAAIDTLLGEKENPLSDEDKESLLKRKAQDLEIKKLMQGIIQAEKQKEIDLQTEIAKMSQDIIKDQAHLDKKAENILELQKKINEKKKKKAELILEIDKLSQGVHEIPMQKIVYQPDDEVNEGKVKASQYVGTLNHVLKVDKRYTLISQEKAETYIPKVGEYLMVIRGTQYELLHQMPALGSKIEYYFQTKWKGDGVIPQISLNWFISNEDFNEAAIINKDAEVRLIEKDLLSLEEELIQGNNSYKWWEDRLNKLKASLDEKKAKLEVVDPS
jgi:hypothetical protein